MSSRPLDIITEPDNTIIDMIKPGDYIFYKTKEFGLWPAVVEMVGKRWLRIEGPTGKMIWVSKSNCQLQEDWRKENEQ